MKQNDQLAAASMQIAISHLGQREAHGRNDGPYVDQLEKKFGLKGQPWCAMECTQDIADAAVRLGIKPLLARSPSSTEIFSQARKKGLLLKQPLPYCIGLLRGSGGTPGKTHHHTFRVVSIDTKTGIVHGLDGNWGNQMQYTTHPIAGCDFVAVA